MSSPNAARRSPWRRRAVYALAGLTALSGVVGAVLVPLVSAIGMGYYAKLLCSEAFVARRAPQTVVAEDLSQFFPRVIMWVTRWSVDRDAGTAVAHMPGIARGVAQYRDGLGCALQFEERGVARAASPARQGGLVPVGMRPTADASVAWPRAERADARLQAVLDEAFAERDADPRRQRCTRAVVVVRDGAIVAERYANGFSAESRFPGWSIAKSVTHALIGVLVAEHRLRLDEPMPVPEWAADERRHITWEHMLRMSSGLGFDETYANPRSAVNLMLFASADTGGFAAATKLASAPGSTWAYTSGTSNVLTRALKAKVGPAMSYAEFPRRALFERIGMTSAILEADGAGTFVGSSFIYATARDFARFGWLYAMDGVWNGERILPEGWVTHAATPTPHSKDNRYGAHFWLSVPPEDRHYFKGALPTMLHAAGFAAQWVTIIPSERLVIVRHGHSLHPAAWNHSKFIADVREALAIGRE